MIYYLTTLFVVLFYLPVDFLNWHARVYWWALDNPIYTPVIDIKLQGSTLYYCAMIFIYLAVVVMPAVLLIGLPLLVQIIATVYPSRGMLLFAQNFARVSLDSLAFLRTPFTFKQEKTRWVWSSLEAVGLAGFIALGFNFFLRWLTSLEFKMPPNTFALCLGILVVHRLGKFEVGLVWNINENFRRMLDTNR